MIELSCTIKSVIYINDESGYAVLTAQEDGGKLFTLVFRNGMIDPKIGYNLIVSGDWVDTERFGRQFVAQQYQEVKPTTVDGIIEYLSSGLFRGIGEKTARKITYEFGVDTINVIEKTPDLLYRIKGIGKKTVQSLIEEWEEHKYVHDIIEYFIKYGLTTNMIMKIYKQYGKSAIDLVTENPYRLSYEIDGVGFKRADAIAMNLGIEKNDPRRIQSCINFVLSEEAEDGHTFQYRPTLIKKCNDNLEIENSLIDDTITEMLENDDLKTIYGNEIFLPGLYYSEKNIASKLTRLYQFIGYNRILPGMFIEDIEKEIGIEYNEKQIEAINTAINNNVMILTGGPGTGKTTVLLGIIKVMQMLNKSIACAAPTGRAAKRMSEVTKLPAKTIHRLLEYTPVNGYERDENNPLYQDVIIIDEVSMVNVVLMDKLLKAVKPSAKLILVGDENQLPSIGAGNILHDIIVSEKLPVVTLKEIFRQAEGSKIITNSHNIINNKPIIVNNSDPNTDFFFIKEKNADNIETIINDLVTSRLPRKYGVIPTDIQVLSPRRKNIQCCSDELNKMLQKSINNNPIKLQHGDTIFKVGDKVMQIKNNYEKEVFNGDVGFITDIDTEFKIVTVEFDDNFIVRYDHIDLDELVLAYATTIHKSQGSEYPIIIIPLILPFSIMLKRNLLYTGITRAKDICIIIGDEKALIKAIKDDSVEKRNTMLADWLLEMIN